MKLKARIRLCYIIVMTSSLALLLPMLYVADDVDAEVTHVTALTRSYLSGLNVSETHQSGLVLAADYEDITHITQTAVVTPLEETEEGWAPTVECAEDVQPEETPIESEEAVAESEVTTYAFDMTDAEARDLAALIKLEGGGESVECQLAIGSTVLNRCLCGRYDSVTSAIYAKNQYEPACRVPSTEPGELQIEVVDQLRKNGPTIPLYVLYFRANYYHSWGDQVPYMYDGSTYFSYSQRMYNEVTQQ